MLINPWLFYLIGAADALTEFFTIIGMFSIIGGGIITLLLYIENGFSKLCKTSFKVAIFGIIFTFIGLLIPTKEVSYQMLAASLVTKDNIEYVTEEGKNLVDYIIESAETLLRNEKIQYAEDH